MVRWPSLNVATLQKLPGPLSGITIRTGIDGTNDNSVLKFDHVAMNLHAFCLILVDLKSALFNRIFHAGDNRRAFISPVFMQKHRCKRAQRKKS